IAVIITIIVSWLINFQAMGGKIVGEIPAGLPSFTMPIFNMKVFWEIVINAMVISLIGFMEAISIAKAMAIKTKEHIDPNQELIGQGFANIVGSMSQSYPSSGSFSRSAVNLNAGAKTGMASVYTALTVMITLLFFSPLLYHLPHAVLAAVIILAVFGLINFKIIKHTWQISKLDGIIAIVTFIATLGFAPHLEKGILLGAGLAIILYFYRIKICNRKRF
ncbi:MAG: sodium-independent anion transporter, partial [Proteobacteria bacterium]|nr:sodium-independent anion transporter [Pseudomonadota bacterium]